jgi:hypothetical protein
MGSPNATTMIVTQTIAGRTQTITMLWKWWLIVHRSTAYCDVWANVTTFYWRFECASSQNCLKPHVLFIRKSRLQWKSSLSTTGILASGSVSENCRLANLELSQQVLKADREVGPSVDVVRRWNSLTQALCLASGGSINRYLIAKKYVFGH